MVFTPVERGEPLSTAAETQQTDLSDVQYWAAGLTEASGVAGPEARDKGDAAMRASNDYVSAMIAESITVTTVGLGLDFNEDLMTRLARRSDGNTYFVEHSSDLSRIFAAELGDVMSVIARYVTRSKFGGGHGD